jgi:hypothetical protein
MYPNPIPCKSAGQRLHSLSDDPIVLVAVLNDQTVAGFLHLHSVTDYYTESKNGHVADLVVAQAPREPTSRWGSNRKSFGF